VVRRKKGKMKNEYKRVAIKNPFAAQAKILWHTDRLCSFLRNGSTFPVHIEISPTSVCNMSCEWCISSYLRRNEHIQCKTLKRFLYEFRDLGGMAIGWSGGGEPTLYPDFKEVIEEAQFRGLKQGVFTNGLFKDELIEPIGECMDWVRFSLDTTDKEIFCDKKGVRGESYEKVLSNLKSLCEYPARVVVNVELDKWNVTHMEEVIATSKLLGADVVQIRPLMPRPYKKDEMVDSAFFSRCLPLLKRLENMGDEHCQVFISWDKFEDFIAGEPYGRTYDKCQYHHFFCVLNANGDLGVCMYRLDDPNFIFGNVNESSLRSIWNGEKRKAVIQHCNEDIDFSKCQVCCKGGELNKLLHFIRNPDPKSDPDFF